MPGTLFDGFAAFFAVRAEVFAARACLERAVDTRFAFAGVAFDFAAPARLVFLPPDDWAAFLAGAFLAFFFAAVARTALSRFEGLPPAFFEDRFLLSRLLMLASATPTFHC